MTIRTSYYGNSQSKTWRDMRETIRAARREYKQYVDAMTPYEQLVIARDIAEKTEQMGNQVISGVLGEWDQAVENLSRRLDDVETAKRNEVARWDAARLGAEMQVYDMRVSQTIRANQGHGVIDPEVISRLKGIYHDAKTCGDPYKARAAAEVMRGVLGHGKEYELESRARLNDLAQEAGRDLEASKDTPEIQAAHAAAAEAVKELNQAHGEIYDTADALGGLFPNGELRETRFINALARVQQTPGGGFQISEPKEK